MSIEEAAAAEMRVEDLKELKRAFNSGGAEECRRLLEKKRDDWKFTELNVAVIGNSGVGKSSFINAIRGLTADDKGGAPVSVNECVVKDPKICSFSHPDNPLLKFWDLPGVGTDRYRRDSYLKEIEIDRYDFFLLITAVRFTENDTWLAEEIRKRGKKYYLIRTKIDNDLSNNKLAHPKTHKDEKAVEEDIRESIQQQLRANGHADVRVFLIDNYDPTKFGFEDFKYYLAKDFPEVKKKALILTLKANSNKMISLKVEQLRSRAWGMAILSAIVAAVPVPGASVGANYAMVTRETGVYFKQLDLDEQSLSKCYPKPKHRPTSSDDSKLQSIVDGSLGRTGLNCEGIKNLLKRSSRSLLDDAATLEFFRFIPIYGAYTIYQETQRALEAVIDEMERVALEVVKEAVKNMCDDESNKVVNAAVNNMCDDESNKHDTET